MLVFKDGEKPRVLGEKSLQAEKRLNSKLNARMTSLQDSNPDQAGGNEFSQHYTFTAHQDSIPPSFHPYVM